MGLLEGHRAVVTGGASGIGRATCERMAAEGAAVAVLDRNGEAAAKVAAGIGGVAYEVDVRDAEGLTAAVDGAAERLGGLSLLFNNAGIGNSSPLAEWDPAEWDRIVGVNLTGVYLGFRAAVPHILAGGGGAI